MCQYGCRQEPLVGQMELRGSKETELWPLDAGFGNPPPPSGQRKQTSSQQLRSNVIFRTQSPSIPAAGSPSVCNLPSWGYRPLLRAPGGLLRSSGSSWRRRCEEVCAASCRRFGGRLLHRAASGPPGGTSRPQTASLLRSTRHSGGSPPLGWWQKRPRRG